MKENQSEFAIEKMAKTLKVSRSNYYNFLHKKPSRRAMENEKLSEEIKSIHEKSRGVYGSPRIYAELKKEGRACSRKRVAILMRKQGLRAKIAKFWRKAPKQRLAEVVAPNYLEGNFTTSMPNRVWAGDITHIPTEEGWLYLAVVMDLFSRKVVGFSMENKMNSSLVMKALNQALCHRSPKEGLIHHSDRGSQYTSNEFKKMTEFQGITLSMSGKGYCYDNAVVESFFHSLKGEHINFFHFKTREEAMDSIFEYIEAFYNKKRSHSSLGYLSPQEFEKAWEENIRVLAV
jgi:transposase InsO family protein